MSPNILSTTVGVSLPSYDISREIVKPAVTRIPNKSRTVVLAKTKFHAQLFALVWSKAMVIILVVFNILCFGFYIYNVNSAQATQYSLRSNQEHLRTLQDKTRQLQVRIADSTSIIRSQQIAQNETDFVAIGTPEFIGKANDAVVTMR